MMTYYEEVQKLTTEAQAAMSGRLDEDKLVKEFQEKMARLGMMIYGSCGIPPSESLGNDEVEPPRDMKLSGPVCREVETIRSWLNSLNHQPQSTLNAHA